MSVENPIAYEVVENHIAVITLDVEETRNAQDTAFLYALNDAFDKAAHDDEVKCIILQAEGPHFSSGHDMRERDLYGVMKEHDTISTWGGFEADGEFKQFAREQEIYVGLCERWRNLPKPTIAVVQGKCIAGGIMLVWPMDIIIAAEDALFMDNTVGMGVNGMEYFTHPFELGPRKAKEMLFTSDWVTAEEGLRLGMVNHVVPVGDERTKALEIARKVIQRPLIGLRLAKESVNTAEDTMGRREVIKQAFAYHHMAHAQNMLVHGGLIDPTMIKASFGKKKREAEKSNDAAE